MVAITPPTHHIVPADKRQVTDRRPQTHPLTSQNLVFCARLSINGYIDPLTEQMSLISFVFEKLI